MALNTSSTPKHIQYIDEIHSARKKKKKEKRGTIPCGIASEFDSESRTDVLNSFLCLLSTAYEMFLFDRFNFLLVFCTRKKISNKWTNRKLFCVIIEWKKNIEENTAHIDHLWVIKHSKHHQSWKLAQAIFRANDVQFSKRSLFSIPMWHFASSSRFSLFLSPFSMQCRMNIFQNTKFTWDLSMTKNFDEIRKNRNWFESRYNIYIAGL